MTICVGTLSYIVIDLSLLRKETTALHIAKKSREAEGRGDNLIGGSEYPWPGLGTEFPTFAKRVASGKPFGLDYCIRILLSWEMLSDV
jgi:hypothetical protein